MYSLREGQLRAITDDHLLQAVSDITIISAADVILDCNGRDQHFHPTLGFGFFDPSRVGYGSALHFNIHGFCDTIGGNMTHMPAAARTAGCMAVRRELFDRLQALRPRMEPLAASILGGVPLRSEPTPTSVEW